jgi:hypothetical protein
MMSDMHSHWMDRLSEYRDGSLDDEERSALEAHLSVCPECANALAEIDEVIRRARALGEIPPARNLWPDIEAALSPSTAGRTGGVIPLPTQDPSAGARPSGVYLSRPQLAAAATIVALVSAAATWALGPRPPTRSAQAPPPTQGVVMPTSNAKGEGPPTALADELSHLEAALAAAQQRLDPNTVRILQKNLDVIDRAIQDSQRALATDPADPFLREHLNAVYLRKVAYLREATSIAGWAG